MLRQGMHDLRVWPGVEGDGHDPSTTPGKTSGKDDEMSRLAKVGLYSLVANLRQPHIYFHQI